MRILKRFLSILLVLISTLSLSSCKLVEWWIDKRSSRSYIIRFHANGGEGQMDDLVVENGEGYLPACAFTREGYECMAWSTDESGKKLYTRLSNLTFWLPSGLKKNDIVDLYAVWTTPGFKFNVQGFNLQYAIISSYTGTAKDVVVPAFTNGHYESPSVVGSGPVKRIGSGIFAGHTEIETVSNLPVYDIPAKLFYECTSLKSISLWPGVGEKIEEVGAQAFYNCSSLESIEFVKNSNVSIGEEAFYGCTSIKKLVIPQHVEKIEANAFYGWTEEQTIEFTWHTENIFGDEWLNGCSANIVWREEVVSE